MRRTTVVVFLAVFGLTVAACGGSSDETTSDPWGLDAVTEPTSQEEINVNFLAMPDEIDGMTAQREDGDHIGGVMYSGEGSAGVTIRQVGKDDRATTMEQLELIASNEAFAELDSNLDSDAATVWLYGTLLEEGDEQILYWGDPSDGLLFVFDADTAEHLDALVAEFISAASET
ncbi:MAG: hypothetical protein PVJ28_12275 [Acidimicrobiia bacterium]|jgi:hypothetical protein